ncbi:protein of unknown function [Pseudomonas sp. JV551A1]|nr:protein of unknown function [Pseudomonas sp. JV551A1]
MGKIGQVAWSIVKEPVLCMLATGQSALGGRAFQMIFLEGHGGTLVARIFSFCLQEEALSCAFPSAPPCWQPPCYQGSRR